MYLEKRLRKAETMGRLVMPMLLFFVVAAARGLPLLCQLIGACLGIWVFLCFNLVVWNSSISGFILAWSVGPSAGY